MPRVTISGSAVVRFRQTKEISQDDYEKYLSMCADYENETGDITWKNFAREFSHLIDERDGEFYLDDMDDLEISAALPL